MGRVIHISQPMVINTELQPLQESVFIEPSASVEQWIDANNNVYSPDRTTNPLVLTAKISVVDTETNLSYKPTISRVEWYVLQYSGSDFKETRVTSSTKTDDYYIGDNYQLVVRANVPYDHGVTIRAVVVYIDPRDSGTEHKIQATQLLTTNRDAKQIYPTLDVNTPNAQSFNPLVDSSYDSNGKPHGYFDFTVIAMLGNNDVTNNIAIVWYALDGTNEVLADTMPWYVSGQNTKKIRIDAMFGEDIRLIARAKASVSATMLYPCRCYRSVGWRIPNPQVHTISPNGQALRSNFSEMSFDTIVNLKNKVLDDTTKERHIYFNWKTRKSNETTITDRGWCQSITLSKDILRNVRSSTTGITPNTLVFPEAHILGAYEKVTIGANNTTVTCNNETVYCRPD